VIDQPPAARVQSVRPVTPELLDSAAALLAESFFSNPAHTYLCPDPRRRLAQLEWLLGGNLRLQDLGASFCLAEGPVVDAMGFWTRSTAPKIGTLRKIRAGLLGAPARLGWAGVRRLFEVTGEIDRHLERAMEERPYWYLNNMVVRERLRGTGVGTRLLREQIPAVAKSEPTYAIALSTQRPENVTFYQRLGFEVVLDRIMGSGPGAFRNWVMVHSAAGSAGSRYPIGLVG
jgi:GNAT superfamily N-acetyltransferase